jgi:hypothetical protein
LTGISLCDVCSCHEILRAQRTRVATSRATEQQQQQQQRQGEEREQQPLSPAELIGIRDYAACCLAHGRSPLPGTAERLLRLPPMNMPLAASGRSSIHSHVLLGDDGDGDGSSDSTHAAAAAAAAAGTGGWLEQAAAFCCCTAFVGSSSSSSSSSSSASATTTAAGAGAAAAVQGDLGAAVSKAEPPPALVPPGLHSSAAAQRQLALRLSMGRMLEHMLQVMEHGQMGDDSEEGGAAEEGAGAIGHSSAAATPPWLAIDNLAVAPGDEATVKPRLFLYSGHDWTLMPLLMALQPGFGRSPAKAEWVPFAADLALELWEEEEDAGGETAGRPPQRRRRYCQLRYCGQVLTLPACCTDPDLPVQTAAAGRSKMIGNLGGGGGGGRTPGAQPHYALYPVAAVRRWLEAEGLLLASVGEYNTLCGNNR